MEVEGAEGAVEGDLAGEGGGARGEGGEGDGGSRTRAGLRPTRGSRVVERGSGTIGVVAARGRGRTASGKRGYCSTQMRRAVFAQDQSPAEVQVKLVAAREPKRPT